MLGEDLATRVEQDDRGADERRERRDEIVDPALGENDLLEPFLRGERAAQDCVLLVDELRERRLGDGDEGQLVGDLEDREVTLGGRCSSAGGTSSKPMPIPKPSAAS